ncbi:hypothetical protein L1787_00215 [Acuticoccus sp. M5D2P5]|uniref:hypothetical protein n=1 Tax=Acuticoccus kalidii TaxID=2910977 RepID=UPI001F3FBC07|nr:hypothetical protein [Acuticoccus kalidii]MCF3931834.1 hypothetical protein [Acuticoccus kalidii]
MSHRDEIETQPLEGFNPMLTVRRIGHGVRSHIGIRATEWWALLPMAGMGLVLMGQPQMFETSPSFDTLERWASQGAWSTFAIMCASFRCLALIVNGTFAAFRFSPHVRAAASLAGAVFWWQLTLGFLDAALFNGGAWSAVIAYGSFTLAEVINVWRSFFDTAPVPK